MIDNGPGMDYRIVQSLYGGEKVEHTGIGMMNGLQIVTSEEGTYVQSAHRRKTIDRFPYTESP